MSDTSTESPAIWFWYVAAIALIWNLLGVTIYVSEVMFGAGGASHPLWYTLAFAVAVFAGTLGCIFLLLRRQWALWAFIASLIAVLIQQGYQFLLTDIGQSLSGSDYALAVTVLAVAILLTWLARWVATKGWLK